MFLLGGQRQTRADDNTPAILTRKVEAKLKERKDMRFSDGCLEKFDENAYETIIVDINTAISGLEWLKYQPRAKYLNLNISDFHKLKKELDEIYQKITFLLGTIS